MDLDLFVNFKSEDDVLSCTVGYPNQHCGLTAYHGDNKGSKLGRSTEAITIKVVGRFDYLVYINALLKQDNVKGATIPPAQYQHILLARPVLKYYNSQSEAPIRGFYLWKMQQSGSNVFKGLIDLADLQPYEENPRFGLAAFCILANELQHDIRARGFADKKWQVWGVKTVSTPPTKVQTYVPYSRSQKQDLPTAKDTYQADKDQSICYIDHFSSVI